LSSIESLSVGVERIEARKGSGEKKLDPYVGLRERSMNKERRKRES